MGLCSLKDVILSPRPTVANSCTNQCEWHRLRMEAIFSLKIWGSYRVYLYAEPEWFDTMIICESMWIRREWNTNWYDAVRCNNMQHDGDMMQYETVRWWWRINTIALWCDENTIGTNRNLHEPMRTCWIQYDNAIVAHRIATYWVATYRRRISVRMYNQGHSTYPICKIAVMHLNPAGRQTGYDFLAGQQKISSTSWQF